MGGILNLGGLPAHRVLNTILRSQVPESWLHRRKRSTDEITKLAEEFRQWSTLREVGVRRYVLREGALKIGLGFFAILVIARAIRSDAKLESMHWTSILGLSIPLGVAIAAMLWYWREHRFAYRDRLLNEA